MRYRSLYAFIMSALLMASLSHADSRQLEIIPMQHRPAEALLKPLFRIASSGTSITATGNQLIIRATPAELAQLRLLIEEMDTPLTQLRISVRRGDQSGVSQRQIQGRYSDTDRHNDHASGIQTGSITLDGRSATQPAKPSGVTLSTKTTRIIVHRSAGRSQSNSIQQLRATEGYPAYIETGKEIPFISAALYGHHTKAITQEYKSVITGFYVMSQLTGNNRVTLHISTQKESSEDNKTIKSTNYRSTVNGKLGEWIALGGTTSRGSNNYETSVARRYRASSNVRQTLYLKVEKIH